MLGVARGPAIGPQGREVFVSHAQTQQHITQVCPRFEVMALRSRQHREQYRRAGAGWFAPQELPVLAFMQILA